MYRCSQTVCAMILIDQPVVQSRSNPHSKRPSDLDLAGLCWVLDYRWSLLPLSTKITILVTQGINTTPWTVGSSLGALGLVASYFFLRDRANCPPKSVGQSMAMVIVATLIIAALAVGCGWIGSHQHLGFTLTSRRCEA